MSIFRKIFGNFVSSSKDEKPRSREESKYFPEVELAVDEEFTDKFKKNGGKFLYCLTPEELNETFISILQENDWFEKEALTFEKNLQKYLYENRLTYVNPQQPEFILTSCESLIANEGSILFSSQQFSQFKPSDLPINIVVMATTSQITRSKSDGLRKIKTKYGSNIPSNISTLQCFKECAKDDFLQYGNVRKNLYLLLLEDL